jgi:hypothetical protein
VRQAPGVIVRMTSPHVLADDRRQHRVSGLEIQVQRVVDLKDRQGTEQQRLGY